LSLSPKILSDKSEQTMGFSPWLTQGFCDLLLIENNAGGKAK